MGFAAAGAPRLRSAGGAAILARQCGLLKNPNDEGALVDRGVDDERLARTSRYAMFWSWLAAKDLEKAIHLDPKDFSAWHNYGDVNYDAGDDWTHHNHANALRAAGCFQHAIALNPRSPRSYLGRGGCIHLERSAHASAISKGAAARPLLAGRYAEGNRKYR